MTSSRFAGLADVNILPDAALTHFPAMRFW
jgi:hypothetical protein